MKILPISFLLLLFLHPSRSMSVEKKATKIKIDEKIEFKGLASIPDEAFDRAIYTLKKMLSNDQALYEKLKKQNFKIEIIGKDQTITDLESYAYLKNEQSSDGRSYSDMRGLGDVNLASVGEENLLCLEKQQYFSEDIFVHEFAHSVMFNLDSKLKENIENAYKSAKEKNLYPKTCYMMADSQEYWAEGTQAWFNATVRLDVNGGINTREKIKKHDPDLAKILDKVYGETELVKRKNCPY